MTSTGTIASICASHTPLIRNGIAAEHTKLQVREAFGRLAGFASSMQPDLIIQFAPDHFGGFFYDLMPAICVGAAAQSIGDWGTRAEALNVPEPLARDLAESLIHSDFDVALSYRMQVDHGFVQIWEEMFGTGARYPAPVIPIFINCAAPPLISYRRARLLGEAVGRWAIASGKRVLFAASGGLSHDPPTPDILTASDEVRERLIAGRNPSLEARETRETRVLAAGASAVRGEGPCQPLNETWDRDVIALCMSGDIARFDAFQPAQVRELAGRGANEILTWVAALAAQGVAGDARRTLEFYEPIDGWIAGMAMLSAVHQAS
jgi:2,3-dihydroxyphenylpropionate 1,2-dioxygenase